MKSTLCGDRSEHRELGTWLLVGSQQASYECMIIFAIKPDIPKLVLTQLTREKSECRA